MANDGKTVMTDDFQGTDPLMFHKPRVSAQAGFICVRRKKSRLPETNKDIGDFSARAIAGSLVRLAVPAGFSASLVKENKDVILKHGDKVAKLPSVFSDRIQMANISGNMFSQIRERGSSTGGKPSDSQIFMRLATSNWKTESPEIPRITAQAPSRNQTRAEGA